jgi:hypothetical protein
MTSSMHISPEYTVDDWQKLTLDNDKEDDWQKAIDIFKDRIYGRFLKPVELIESDTFAGFAVMALDCLLIETFQQFKEGVNKTPDKKSGCYFVHFLTETSFNKWFSIKTADMFYKQIRCGILHQAEAKGSSRIRIDIPVLVEYTDDNQGLIINRKLFHRQLVKEFESYLKRLQDPSEQDLRNNFKKKMNFICRLSKT